ncbi:MAG: permease, partial [Bacteroidaceae bacterium]|nr:permease [Bacteroidaceae bacterium]
MFKEYILPLLDLLNEMSSYLLLGFLIAGILHEFVPQKVYRQQLSKNNFRSVLMATLIGVPLPLCSCGVIPTAMSLRRSGASKGATTAFLISTPQTGVDSILATASLLGIPFAIIRPVVAFITALIGGSIINKFDKGAEEETTIQQEEHKHKSFKEKCIGALRYGFIEMLQDIGKWIVIGLIVAAIITILLPDNFFIQNSSSPILNMLLIMLFAIPMYLCATGSIPIAAALMLKGLSPGAALVLLMAGPVTNMASILVINKVLGRKTLILYLAIIIIGAFTFGIIIDYTLPAEWFTGAIKAHSAGCCAPGTAW